MGFLLQPGPNQVTYNTGNASANNVNWSTYFLNHVLQIRLNEGNNTILAWQKVNNSWSVTRHTLAPHCECNEYYEQCPPNNDLLNDDEDWCYSEFIDTGVCVDADQFPGCTFSEVYATTDTGVSDATQFQTGVTYEIIMDATTLPFVFDDWGSGLANLHYIS